MVAITIQKNNSKFLLEIDPKAFERIAASLGFYGEDFVKSIETSEKEYKQGKFSKLKSLKQLRKK
jgi:hypothetical protein